MTVAVYDQHGNYLLSRATCQPGCISDYRNPGQTRMIAFHTIRPDSPA